MSISATYFRTIRSAIVKPASLILSRDSFECSLDTSLGYHVCGVAAAEYPSVICERARPLQTELIYSFRCFFFFLFFSWHRRCTTGRIQDPYTFPRQLAIVDHIFLVRASRHSVNHLHFTASAGHNGVALNAWSVLVKPTEA